MEYILAHDLGTSGNKATLFSTEGELIASVTYPYPTSYPYDTWVEQNPEDWWQAVIDTTRTLISGIDSRKIIGVSFSGQMMGCICVDKAGTPLRPAIIWADMRADKQIDKIEKRIEKSAFYRLTGHRLSPSYGGPKFMWIKENEPEVYHNTYKMLNAKDYIILKLTNQFVTENTDASSTCFMDLDRLNWSQDLLYIMGIDYEKLPRLCQSTDIAGYITNEAAKILGLPSGIPVICGGGDGICAAIGTGCIKEGVAHCSLGTSSWISITSKQAIYDEAQRTFNWAHIIPGYILPTGTMQCGGGAYAWYVNEFCEHEKILAKKQNLSLYDYLETEIAQSPLGSNGLLFLPYLMGERSPRWNLNARAGFIGIQIRHKKKDFLRAVQEGVAMNLKVVLDVFRDYSQRVEQIMVVGGGAKSKMWQKILSDVFNVAISLPDTIDEAASMGAAITAGVGLGVFEDFNSVDRFMKINHTVYPQKEAVERYSYLSEIFNHTYDALIPIYNPIKDFHY